MSAAAPTQLSTLFTAGTPYHESLLVRICGLLSEADRGRLAQLNRHCYRVIHQEEFSPLLGESGRYALLRRLRRRDVQRICEQTGMIIHYPDGHSSYGQVTRWNDPSPDKLCLGKGAFGVFCVGYALMAKRFIGLKITVGSEESESELLVHHLLSGCENVMQSQDVCRTVAPDGAVTLFQVMEIAGLGSLRRLRVELKQLDDIELRDRILLYIAHSLLKGIASMHGRNIYHLDIKDDNVVINGEGDLRIIDFGCTKQLANGRVNCIYSQGDYNYFSPERWTLSNADTPNEAEAEAAPIDSWAAGVTLAELLLPHNHLFAIADMEAILSLPFDSLPPHLAQELSGCEGLSRQQLLRELVQRRTGKLSGLPRLLEPIVSGLLAFDPQERMRIDEALSLLRIPDSSGVKERLREMVQGVVLQQRSHASADAAEEVVLSPQLHPLPHFANRLSRPELEAEVRSHLLGDSNLTCIQGLPGMGKSDLANFMLYDEQVRRAYSSYYWFRGCDSDAQIRSQLRILAQELGLADSKTPFHVALLALRHHFEKRDQPALLVFDNADNPSLLSPYTFSNVHLLVTSRSSEWPESVKVGALAADEAHTLVCKLLRRDEPKAKELCEQLANLPLGIVQACAFIRNRRCSVGEYLKLFQRSPTLLSHSERQDGHRELPYSLQRMYELTFAELQETGAYSVLERLACLAPEGITDSLLQGVSSGLPCNSVIARDQLLAYEILRQSSPGVYSLHRLPRRAVQNGFVGCASLADAVTGIWDQYDWSGARPNRDLVPHAESALELSTGSSAGGLSHELLARLKLLLLDHYASFGKMDEAETLSSQLDTMLKQHWPSPEKMRAQLLAMLGSARRGMGQLSESADLLSEAQQLTEQLVGVGSRDHVVSLVSLALTLRELGQWRAGLEAQLQALQIMESQTHLAHLRAECMLNAAGGMTEMGQYHSAIAICRQAISLVEKEKGSEDPMIGLVLSALALAFDGLGKRGAAVEIAGRGLSILQESYGTSHHLLVSPLLNLANLESGDSAIAYLDRAERIVQSNFGDKHPHMALVLTNRAPHLSPPDRAQNYQQAYDLWVSVFGEKHYRVADAIDNLASIETDKARAFTLYSRALEIRRTLFGSDHPQIAESLRKMGAHLVNVGLPGEAIAHLGVGLELLQKLVGQNCVRCAEFHVLLGRAEFGGRQFDNALTQYSRAQALFQDSLGADHPKTLQVAFLIGSVEATQLKFDDALRRFTELFQRQSEVLGATHPDTLATQQGLAGVAMIQKSLHARTAPASGAAGAAAGPASSAASTGSATARSESSSSNALGLQPTPTGFGGLVGLLGQVTTRVREAFTPPTSEELMDHVGLGDAPSSGPEEASGPS